MTTAFYNEHDRFTAAWLERLASGGVIPPGTIDQRSIADVRADDLVGCAQAHFFAGGGGWPIALRLAGVPDDAPVWTGSCPCQPFSDAGKKSGRPKHLPGGLERWEAYRAANRHLIPDKRHLWPEFHRLIAECRPPVVFGEQVASSDGRDWLGAVLTDLEDLGYHTDAADLCAASVGAPHRRQRLFWGAVSLGDPRSPRRPPRERAVAEGAGRRVEGRAVEQPGGSPWASVEWLACADGKSRPTEPGLRPLAHGVSGRTPVARPGGQPGAEEEVRWVNRVGTLKGYGNAIVPQVGAVFVRAFLESIWELT